mgnify:FL=1
MVITVVTIKADSQKGSSFQLHINQFSEEYEFFIFDQSY